MSHAANANCKCSARSLARSLAAVCVSSTRLSLTFILLGLLEKKCSRGMDCARTRESSSVASRAHLASIPIHRGAAAAETGALLCRSCPVQFIGRRPQHPAANVSSANFRPIIWQSLHYLQWQRRACTIYIQKRKLFAPPLLLRQLLSMIAR